MKKAPILGITALLIVAFVALGAFAMPFAKGDTDVRNALEAGNYNAWKEAITSRLTQDRFNRAVDNYQKMSERRTLMQEKMGAVQSTIESGDYQAWNSAIGDEPGAEKLREVITEDNFATYAEMQQAIQDKDFAKAKDLASQLGLPAENVSGRFPMMWINYKRTMGRHSFRSFDNSFAQQ